MVIGIRLSSPDAASAGLQAALCSPDPDAVAALYAAFMGSTNGYESLPTELLSRLEIGGVMHRLAVDLAGAILQEKVRAGAGRRAAARGMGHGGTRVPGG